MLGPFAFQTRWAVDLGISGIEDPITDCGLESGDTVRVLIHNYGGEPQSLVPFKYAVNGVPVPISMPKDGVYTGVVGRDSSDVAEFDNPYSFPPGDYVSDAWTEMRMLPGGGWVEVQHRCDVTFAMDQGRVARI